ncbi:hypothetical protein L7F22_050955 [Adiantum nelumboides]|nr:hypothetical protein [Adiantum nelumboides]
MASADRPSSDAGNSSTRNAWSQIVRSQEAAPSTKKLPQVANSQQIAPIAKESPTNQARGQMQTNAELGFTPSELTLNAIGVASAADARAFDEASEKGEEVVEGLKAVVAVNAITAASSEASENKSPKSGHGDVADARVSRPPWQKPSMGTEGDVKPLPVMGATAWPALTEALNMKKPSEARKMKSSSLKNPHPSAVASVQETISKNSLPSAEGLNHQQGIKNKPSFKGGPVGLGRHAFQPIENGSSFLEHPAMGTHVNPEQSAKQPSIHTRMKGNFSANPVFDKDRNHHHRNDGGGPFHNNNRKWRNNYRDQGRDWHHHGRAYENGGDMATLLHEQRIGPRNMPRQQPFMNMNPGFYSPMPSFQNNGMYYIPHGAPEFLHGPPYFPPMAPPGAVIGLDPFSLRAMLIKQVDYYFSVENLCRDVFLRTHMDEEGFVPVSVIAQFNRIRNLSNNPMVILDALQSSEVVEVQRDRIRRRNDRGKWMLLRDQVYAGKPMQQNNSSGNFSEREVKPTQIVSFEQAYIGSAAERAADGEADAPWKGANTGSPKAADTSLTDAESGKFPSDISIGRINLEEKAEDDGRNSATAQDTSLLGSDASTQSFSRDGSREESAVCNASANNASGCQSLDSFTLQDGPESTHRNQDAICWENNFSDARCLEERSMTVQAAADGKPVCWKAPEGFWRDHSAFLMHRDFEQAAIQPRESDFVLKMRQEDGVEHHGEANERDLDRLINVSHTSLGSFIAVP